MSPRWGSIEKSNVFYKNAAPLELKGRTAEQLQKCFFCIRDPEQSIVIYKNAAPLELKGRTAFLYLSPRGAKFL